MKIRLYDCYESAEKLNVGDEFHDVRSSCSSDMFEVENLDLVISGVRLKGYRKSSRCFEFSWNLTCQSVFIIVDLSTHKVIFTSKDFPRNERFNPSCGFYKDLQKFIDSGFTTGQDLYKIEEDVFEDI